MSALTAFAGLLGGVIGAVLTYWLGIRAEIAKGLQKQRTDSYVEFIEAVSDISSSQREWNQEKLDSALAHLTQAKAKIAVYGSRAVGTALAEYLRHYGKLDSNAAQQSFAAIVALMRADSPQSEPLNPTDMERILFRDSDTKD